MKKKAFIFFLSIFLIIIMISPVTAQSYTLRVYNDGSVGMHNMLFVHDICVSYDNLTWEFIKPEHQTDTRGIKIYPDSYVIFDKFEEKPQKMVVNFCLTRRFGWFDWYDRMDKFYYECSENVISAEKLVVKTSSKYKVGECDAVTIKFNYSENFKKIYFKSTTDCGWFGDYFHP